MSEEKKEEILGKEKELEAVAGGDACFCVLGGGGEFTESDGVGARCACVGNGFGDSVSLEFTMR